MRGKGSSPIKGKSLSVSLFSLSLSLSLSLSHARARAHTHTHTHSMEEAEGLWDRSLSLAAGRAGAGRDDSQSYRVL